jgi:cytochrome c-type biogenesis protein CcmF
MVTFIGIGVSLLVIRRSDMNVTREEFAPTTREFMLSIGSALVMASAVFVTIGTSWPVIMEVLGLPKVAVAIDFYNQVHRILVPAILVVNAISLVMQWRNTTRSVFRRRVLRSSVAAVVGTGVLIAFGVRELWPIALGFGAWFSFAINVEDGLRMLKAGPAMMGAYVSHVGIALLMFGVITTSMYAETYHAVLVHGKPVNVGTYTLTYLGKEQVDKEFRDREKFRYYVRIEHDGQRRAVAPVLYWSDFNQRQSPFLEPGIRWGLMNDLYVSPKNIGREDVFHETTVQKGASAQVPIDKSVTLFLDGFTMPMEEGQTEDGRMQMSAKIVATTANGDTVNVKARTRITTGPNGPAFDPEWTTIPGTTTAVGLINIDRNNEDPSKSKGTFAFYDVSKPRPFAREEFTVEFSVKPLISLVWIGVIAMVTGFAFSIGRSVRMLKKKPTLQVVQNEPLA